MKPHEFTGELRCLVWLRRAVLVALLVGFLVSQLGHPAIRLAYFSRERDDAPRVVSATYLSAFGRLSVSAEQHSGQCPLVILVPLDPPISARLRQLYFELKHHLLS